MKSPPPSYLANEEASSPPLYPPPPQNSISSARLHAQPIPPDYQIYPIGFNPHVCLPGAVPPENSGAGQPPQHLHQPIYSPMMQPGMIGHLPCNGHGFYLATPTDGNGECVQPSPNGLYSQLEYVGHPQSYYQQNENGEYVLPLPVHHLAVGQQNARGETLVYYVSPTKIKHRRKNSYISFVLFFALAIIFMFIFLKIHSDLGRRFLN